MIDKRRVHLRSNLNEIEVDGVVVRPLESMHVEILDVLLNARDIASHDQIDSRLADVRFLRRLDAIDNDPRKRTFRRCVHISSLRRALSNTALCIDTVRGQGYRARLIERAAAPRLRYRNGLWWIGKIRLSRRETTMLLAVMGRPRVAHDDMIEILWPDPDIQALWVDTAMSKTVCDINQKLAGTGWAIRSAARAYRLVREVPMTEALAA